MTNRDEACVFGEVSPLIGVRTPAGPGFSDRPDRKSGV
jgi:hypothetical protein